MLSDQILLGTVLVIPTVVFHVSALVILSKWVDKINVKTGNPGTFIANSLLLGTSVFTIIIIHVIEAVFWASIYLYIDEFSDITKAVYFSVVTATTLGYGDVTLSENWQLLGSFEAVGGLILFGASTAFLIEVMKDFFSKPSK
jgi:hypothetical protein